MENTILGHYIVPQHVGYMTVLRANTGWHYEWAPVKGVYSPPALEPGIRCVKIDIPLILRDRIGEIVGKGGKHLKKITAAAGCLYIFVRDDTIEIWGKDETFACACSLLWKRMDVMSLA